MLSCDQDDPNGIGAHRQALEGNVTSDERVNELFRPLAIRSLTMRNRFAMAPMTRRASPNGVPGADVAEYYRRRAAGGVGLIITEGIRLPQPEAGWPAEIPTLAGDAVLETEFTPGRPGGRIPAAPVDRLLDQFQAGEFDVVAIGRALLADPTWVNRLRDDALDGFNGFDAEVALAGLS